MGYLLTSPLTELKGVGKKRGEQLKASGYDKVRDLLYRFPSSYRDGKVYDVSFDRIGVFSYFFLTVVSAPAVLTLKGRGKTLRYTASDENGTPVQVFHVHQPYLKSRISQNDSAYFGGVLREKNGVFYLFSPSLETKRPDEDSLSPVYPATGGLSSKQTKELISQFLPDVLPQIKETMPEEILEKFHLMPLARALYLIHRPASEALLEMAKYRFAFEELFRFSVRSTLFAREAGKERVPAFSRSDLTPFLSSLPFSLTGAQQKVIGEIEGDMVGEGLIPPMDRLLQGDVGSGKTAVAAAAAYLAAINKKSTLVMAPTEILARQHFASFSSLFAKTGIPVFLLTGSTGKKEREKIFSYTENESPYILIGTHALIEEGTRCRGVALAITDEQHRFGVRMRNLLSRKGGVLHSLVMSATPIPRSLAMFLHAQRQISVLDELPPGRQSVETFYVGESKLPRVYAFLREEVEKGNQAYVVCPLIEDEEGESPMQSAAEELEEVRKNLPEIPSALLHGKMKPEEKARVMDSFTIGETKILVSTTVIEVGVDVPGATVMVVRSAERFGLSQLHQLRGRVGRGRERSYCILVSSHPGKGARERLKKLCDCHDGFELAKYDLETRGPGEFFGTRQSGFGLSSFPGSYSMEMIRDAARASRIWIEKAKKEELEPYAQNVRLN